MQQCNNIASRRSLARISQVAVFADKHTRHTITLPSRRAQLFNASRCCTWSWCVSRNEAGRALFVRLRTRLKRAKTSRSRIIRASAHMCKLLVIVTTTGMDGRERGPSRRSPTARGGTVHTCECCSRGHAWSQPRCWTWVSTHYAYL